MNSGIDGTSGIQASYAQRIWTPFSKATISFCNGKFLEEGHQSRSALLEQEQARQLFEKLDFAYGREICCYAVYRMLKAKRKLDSPDSFSSYLVA